MRLHFFLKRAGNMRIAICDSDHYFIQREIKAIENYCAHLNLQVCFDIYASPNSLLSVEVEKMQVVFLDTVFSDMDGIALAKLIRKRNREAVVVFVTDHAQYAIEGYKVGAFRYILKSKLDAELEALMDDLISKLFIEAESITLKSDDGNELVPLKDIVYIEGTGHRQVLVYTSVDSKPLECRGYLSDLEASLSGKGFIRLQRGFLANMRHVKRIKSYNATMSNGAVIRTSTKKYQDILKRYQDWSDSTN